MYEGAWLEQGLLLNTRFNMHPPPKRTPVPEEKLTLYMCATMWHETFGEMEKIIISIFRWDQFRPHDDREVNNLTTEAHIFFDDAFRTVPVSGERHANQYVEDMVQVIQKVYSLFQEDEQNPFLGPVPIGDQMLLRTPYGGRLKVTLPCGNLLVVHLKDKSLIRHKKRWSQIMYMYYLLGWRLDTRFYQRWLNGEGQDQAQIEREKERERKNTYILALDGDTDFHPPAVMLLIDRLKQYPAVGAACGRIHPIGTGPIVWYQKFEYALTHWLHKTAEHVLGCVLCSPGEDRWLCTLMLQQGWRVEYNAASDAYTNAPEGFKEFYNQVLAGPPSTLANSIDLLGGSIRLARKNRSISRPYLLYEMFIVGSGILIPATICLMADTQVTLAAVLSVLYAFIMMVTMLTIISILVTDNTVFSPLAISFVTFVMVYVVAALLHPQEAHLIVYGLLYILAIPSAYLLLSIYSIVNMNNISWGTREGEGAAAAGAAVPPPPRNKMESARNTMRQLYQQARCCRCPCLRECSGYTQVGQCDSDLPVIAATGGEPMATMVEPGPQNTIVGTGPQNTVVWAGPQNTIVGAGPQNTVVGAGPQNTVVGAGPQNTVVGAGPQNTIVGAGPQNTIVERRPENSSVGVQTSPQSSLKRSPETQFWNDLTERYLKPFPDDEKRETIKSLRELRNMATFIYFFANLLCLVATFTLQLLKGTLSIRIPKYDNSLTFTGDYILVEPVTFMFLFTFVLVVLQFLTMLFHRTYTLIDFIGYVNTEMKKGHIKSSDKLENSWSPEAWVNEDELYSVSQARGTMV
ncbi:chitin synthase chs-1-like [Gadus chalcogrammus]|uniref:chitin synthase chs-1-like n=1 Tax=Gadus chalcogrammus TaxID=1042646 RepID=UPI0024C4C4C7|nr:chitin synthase chs-1-like [Gadus chalcogrammus]